MDETWKDDAKLLSTHLSYLSNAESFDLRALEDTIQMTNRSMTSHFSRWLLHHADLPAHLNVSSSFQLEEWLLTFVTGIERILLAGEWRVLPPLSGACAATLFAPSIRRNGKGSVTFSLTCCLRHNTHHHKEANKLWQEALLTTCSLEHETKSSSTLVEIRPVIPRSKSDSNLYLSAYAIQTQFISHQPTKCCIFLFFDKNGTT